MGEPDFEIRPLIEEHGVRVFSRQPRYN